VGNSGRMMALQHALAPGMTEWRMARMVDRMHFSQNQRTVVTRGNLFEPMSLGDRISGGWRAASGSSNGRSMTRGLGALVLGIGAAALAGAVMRPGRRPIDERAIGERYAG
jgi:hypothetical protein